ncbi:MAG: hypothetical protein M3R02_29855 [Chloroflexota bacterium]|nr:hypothetical protein [Chloroflexota bacterium]
MVQSITTRRPVETLAEKWRRLARQAEESGIEILRVSATGETFASSATLVGELHRVSVDACDCMGHERWGRCSHRAWLLATLGQLPALTSEPAATCTTCTGRGVDPDCTGHAVAGMTIHCPCYACDGAGTVPVDVVISEQHAA